MCDCADTVELLSLDRYSKYTLDSYYKIFPSVLTLFAGQQVGHPACKKTGCWFVGGDDLIGALDVL